MTREELKITFGLITLSPLAILAAYGIMVVNDMFPFTQWITFIGIVGGVVLGISKH